MRDEKYVITKEKRIVRSILKRTKVSEQFSLYHVNYLDARESSPSQVQSQGLSVGMLSCLSSPATLLAMECILLKYLVPRVCFHWHQNISERQNIMVWKLDLHICNAAHWYSVTWLSKVKWLSKEIIQGLSDVTEPSTDTLEEREQILSSVNNPHTLRPHTGYTVIRSRRS